GFIDRLPHALVAAFRATLEEVAEAELVLHVIDASSPEMERHVAAVRRVLEEVGAADVPLVEVLNKMDAVPADGRAPLEQAEGRVAISARTGEGIEALCNLIATRLTLDARRLTFAFDPGSAADRERLAMVYRVGRVVSHRSDAGRMLVEADVPRRFIAQ